MGVEQSAKAAVVGGGEGHASRPPRRSKSQLERLAIPFPPQHVSTVQRGSRAASYVSWSLVQQRLLGTLGPVDQFVVELIRGVIPEMKTANKTYPAVADGVTGVVAEFVYHIDGRQVRIQEIGTCENPAMRDNDGDRAKLALSDATKRAAARIGVGLHLWSKGVWFLPKMLGEDVDVADAPGHDQHINDEAIAPDDTT